MLHLMELKRVNAVIYAANRVARSPPPLGREVTQPFFVPPNNIPNAVPSATPTPTPSEMPIATSPRTEPKAVPKPAPSATPKPAPYAIPVDAVDLHPDFFSVFMRPSLVTNAPMLNYNVSVSL